MSSTKTSSPRTQAGSEDWPSGRSQRPWQIASWDRGATQLLPGAQSVPPTKEILLLLRPPCLTSPRTEKLCLLRQGPEDLEDLLLMLPLL